MAASAGKLAINAALGFDSYLVSVWPTVAVQLTMT